MVHTFDDNHYFLLSTGKRVYVPFGIFGLSPDDGERDRPMISTGYDGALLIKAVADEDELTPAEAVEVADYMIDLWQQFKARMQAHG